MYWDDEKREIQKCAYCGKELDWESTAVHQKYCCKECREKDYEQKHPKAPLIIEIRECAYCGKKFEWKSTKPSQKYCCKECGKKAQEKKHPKVPLKIEMRQCAYCGKEFEWKSSKPNQKYCCKECREKDQKRIHPRKPLKIEMRQCAYCGKEFEWKSTKPSQKYCCKECCYEAAKIRNKLFGGDIVLEELYSTVELKVKSIINGSLGQGKDFNGVLLDYWKIGPLPEKTRDKVLKRDHYECQICKRKDSLHIHHIIKRKDGGSHELDNLITLCASCHRHIETRDIVHATKKCFNNAKKYYFKEDSLKPVARKMDKEYVSNMKKELENIFNSISSNNKGEYNDILLKIDAVIEKLSK